MSIKFLITSITSKAYFQRRFPVIEQILESKLLALNPLKPAIDGDLLINKRVQEDAILAHMLASGKSWGNPGKGWAMGVQFLMG